MNAPDKLLKIPLAPGVYVRRLAATGTRASRRRAALSLLTAMRREKRARTAKTGRAYLKDSRVARHGT